MMSCTQNQVKTPETGVVQKANYTIVFLGEKRITVGPKEISYLRKIASTDKEVRPYDQDAFGWVANRYMRFHYRRLYRMEEKGLITIDVEHGHLTVKLTELGLKVIDAIENNQ